MLGLDMRASTEMGFPPPAVADRPGTSDGARLLQAAALAVESAPGRGSTFTVELPLR